MRGVRSSTVAAALVGCALLGAAPRASAAIAYFQTTVIEVRVGRSDGTYVRFADPLPGGAVTCPLPSYAFFEYALWSRDKVAMFRALAVSAHLSGSTVTVVYDRDICSARDSNVYPLQDIWMQ